MKYKDSDIMDVTVFSIVINIRIIEVYGIYIIQFSHQIQ